MEVFIERTGIRNKVKYSGNVGGLLKRLNIIPDDVLVVRNETLLTSKDRLNDSDKIEILSIISGG